jgi:hypothetical protein
MELPYEAVYFPKSLGIVKVPKGSGDLCDIGDGIGVLTTAKVSASSSTSCMLLQCTLSYGMVQCQCAVGDCYPY